MNWRPPPNLIPPVHRSSALSESSTATGRSFCSVFTIHQMISWRHSIMIGEGGSSLSRRELIPSELPICIRRRVSIWRASTTSTPVWVWPRNVMRSSGNSRRWSDHLLHLLLNPSCQQQRVHLLRKRVSKLYGIQVSETAPMQGHGLRFIYRDTEFDPEYDILVKLPYLSLCRGARHEPG